MGTPKLCFRSNPNFAGLRSLFSCAATAGFLGMVGGSLLCPTSPPWSCGNASFASDPSAFSSTRFIAFLSSPPPRPPRVVSSPHSASASTCADDAHLLLISPPAAETADPIFYNRDRTGAKLLRWRTGWPTRSRGSVGLSIVVVSVVYNYNKLYFTFYPPTPISPVACSRR